MDTAQAGWFVDPIERFSGRYFDGENWTSQVSDQGVLHIDQEWCSAIGDSKVVDARDSDVAGLNGGGASSGTAGLARYSYEPVVPVAQVVIQPGGRNDRRQVHIPVAEDRRKSNRQAMPLAQTKQHA